jgi:hypothetical protein
VLGKGAENEKNNHIEQAATAEEWLRKAWEELYSLREMGELLIIKW